jgi:5-methylcytosine-specific restriction endonuclease McrA
MNCLHCSKETTNPKFCCRSCSAKETNKMGKRPLIEKNCKFCSKPVGRVSHEDRRKVCQSCKDLRHPPSSQTTLAELHSRLSVFGKHPSWKNASVRENNRRSNSAKRAGGCKICGYTKHVELCHVVPISEFPLSATLAEVNHPSNIIPLCPNHHWEFDHASLDHDALMLLEGLEPSIPLGQL